MDSQVFTKMLEQAPFVSWPRRGAGRVGSADHPRTKAPSGGSQSSSASSRAQVSSTRCPHLHLSHACASCLNPPYLLQYLVHQLTPHVCACACGEITPSCGSMQALAATGIARSESDDAARTTIFRHHGAPAFRLLAHVTATAHTPSPHSRARWHTLRKRNHLAGCKWRWPSFHGGMSWAVESARASR